MALDALPTELVHLIARSFHLERDINALARVNRRFNAIFNPALYKRNAKRLSSYLLQWATKQNSPGTAEKALQCGADPNEVKWGEQSALQFAVTHGRLLVVKLLLDYGAINCGPMILTTAASHGFVEMVELLLDHGANPNATSLSQTPLMFAAERGHESTFTLLLQRGADPFANDKVGSSAVYYALNGGSIKILAKLLDLGLGMYHSFGSTRTAYQIHAAKLGRLDAVKLFNERGVDVNFADYHGCTALWEAASEGHLELVQYLLEKGASLEIHDNWGNTPALKAAEKGKNLIVKILLDQRANLEHANEEGHTMLSIAAVQGSEGTVKLLLDRGANIEAVDKKRRTPLHLAADTGHLEIVKLLINKGANVNYTDGVSSPLLLAARRGNPKTVKLLLRAGASIEFTTPRKQTSLSFAAISRGGSAADTVSVLLESGANTEATDKYGQTALNYTLMEENSLPVIKLLADKGANFHVIDNSGQNLLMCAAICGHGHYIPTLIEYGLKVNDQDRLGLTALHHAVMNRVTEWTLLLLLQSGADPEIRNEEGLSVYELARVNGNIDLLMEAERKLESKTF